MAQKQARKETPASCRNLLLLVLSPPSQTLARHRPVLIQSLIFNSPQSTLLSLSITSTVLWPSLSTYVAPTTLFFFPDPSHSRCSPFCSITMNDFPSLFHFMCNIFFLISFWHKPTSWELSLANLLDVQRLAGQLGKARWWQKLLFSLFSFFSRLGFLRVVDVRLGLASRSHSAWKMSMLHWTTS